jgi:hypothetical protein
MAGVGVGRFYSMSEQSGSVRHGGRDHLARSRWWQLGRNRHAVRPAGLHPFDDRLRVRGTLVILLVG